MPELVLCDRYKLTESGLQKYNRYIVNSDYTLSLVNRYKVVSETFESIRFTVEPYVASTSGTVKFELSSRLNVIIDWGDGTSQDVGGQASSCSHVYTNFSQGLIYNITITPTTIYSNSSNGRLTFDAKSGLRHFYSIGKGFRLSTISFSGSTITGIDAEAFKDGESITTLGSLFYNCPQFTYLPETLLKNCINVNYMLRAFSGCGITVIPEMLLNSCTKLTNAMYLFQNTNITTIPSNLFVNNPLIETFYSAFSNCLITSIPLTLFDSCQNVKSFWSTFRNCKSITSAVPELWNRTNVEDSSGCFYGCTKATNYSSIPAEWR